MNASEQGRRGFWSRLGSALTTTRLVLSNLIFFVLLAVILIMVLGGGEGVEVPEGGALDLDLAGTVVEQAPPVDPLSLLFGGEDQPHPIELRDVLDAVEYAAEDERIAALVLELDDFQGAAPAVLTSIGKALEAFKASGKPLIAYGATWSQEQYYLASFASQGHLYLHPMGQVLLTGYGVFPTYFDSALDKLRVDVHVFRVGEYKSAVEPFIRDDMSPQAKAANRQLLGVLWGEYLRAVAANRGMSPTRFDAIVSNYADRLTDAGGDTARMALEERLVDELLTRDALRSRMQALVGADDDEAEDTWRQVEFEPYLKDVQGKPLELDDQTKRVAVVVGEGTIIAGEGTPDTIASKSFSERIRRARDKDDVAALVVRLNTPGGSAYASEVIRQELELAQVAGLPVVISMGGMAASGGYWIASTADMIFAEPATITGSIGIFGLIPTFADSLETIGVNTDGVGSTPLSGALNPTMPLNPMLERILQHSVEDGYDRFVNLVAKGRDMSPAEVREIAGGRVWAGRTAAELGLVDGLGEMQDAVAAAAKRAGLEEWETTFIEPELSPAEKLLQRLSGTAVAGIMREALGLAPYAQVMNRLQSAVEQLTRLDDPKHVYALCGACPPVR